MMSKLGLFILSFFLTVNVVGQSDANAKLLLDGVAANMEGYNNMIIEFSQTLVNEDAGINEGDEPPILGKIILQQEKYFLEYLGNTFIFNGKQMYVINNDDKEIIISDGDIDGEDGFIYPSKLLTFYKEGYNYTMGEKVRKDNRSIQIINLFPIDSDSNITKVELAIDLQTKHIYQLTQIGENSSKTTFTISKFKSNQKLNEKLFLFDTEKYSEKSGYTID